MADYLEPGQRIKDSEVTLGDGSCVKLSSLLGNEGLILYFYPKDLTPGCTTQACDFRDNLARLQKLGYGVAGVSSDSTTSHQKFTAKKNLNYPLIADTERKLAIQLGVYGEKKLYGRIMQGIRRTTYLINKQMQVEKVYKNVRAKGHAERLLQELSA